VIDLGSPSENGSNLCRSFPGKISLSFLDSGAKMLALCKFPRLRKSTHKGNHITTLELKLSLSVQGGISLVTWSLKIGFLLRIIG
jgi:hypothetical protein